ncbi:hypothetical protein B0T26DRAFT_678755 [Lasiosphaeria miniovina]|uniref:Uncharacterized protein n=1 Tax=Lasiosphaeria miniovina TaxID=1954250 RepID=A0AA40A4U2_9PEZI|nr:uncharacterized protein B0T26DRAFT_678755 [Lasiosphaeria miniovina]KAK0709314.1 hypothetical protein B0T26DRAFT_678755 [Lasiosphaeria miniovina]
MASKGSFNALTQVLLTVFPATSMDPDMMSIPDSPEEFSLEPSGILSIVARTTARQLLDQYRTETSKASSKSDHGKSSPTADGNRSVATICQVARLLPAIFWKLDPDRHRDCSRREKFVQISRIKQHLARKHTPIYCERCKLILPSEDSYRKHHEQPGQGCLHKDWDPEHGISHQQQAVLHKKSRADLSTPEQWFAIWDLLFPEHARPSSPYIDQGLSDDFCNFRELLALRMAPERSSNGNRDQDDHPRSETSGRGTTGGSQTDSGVVLSSLTDLSLLNLVPQDGNMPTADMMSLFGELGVENCHSIGNQMPISDLHIPALSGDMGLRGTWPGNFGDDVNSGGQLEDYLWDPFPDQTGEHN